MGTIKTVKAIINGKAYNTDTAEIIVEVNPKLYDLWHHFRALYRTKKGAYFIQDAWGQLLVVDKNGVFTNRIPCSHPVENLNDWLAHWKIEELPQREMEYFGIVEA